MWRNLDEIIEWAMLIIDNRHLPIIFPLTINYIFVFISSCKESQWDSIVGLAIFVIEETEFFDCLPFCPTSCDQYLFWYGLVFRVPNKASWGCCARSKMIVSAFLTYGRHAFTKLLLTFILIQSLQSTFFKKNFFEIIKICQKKIVRIDLMKIISYLSFYSYI